MKKVSFSFLKNLPKKEKRITISTVLTLLRIALTPCIVGAMVYGLWGLAFFLFCLASLFDTLDGNLARLLNQKTVLGTCLDPLADKILLISCFGALAFVQAPLFSVPLWLVLFIFFKELVVFSGALFLFYVKGHIEVRPTIIGKMTTLLQIAFICWIFLCYFLGWAPLKTYSFFLGVVTVFTGISLIQYVRIGLAQLRTT